MSLLDTTDNDKLIQIKRQYSRENSFKKMCNELLTLWKGKFTNPKWEQVTQALRNVELNNLAEKLKTAVQNPPNALDISWVAEKICVELKDDMEWERFGMYLLVTKDNNKLILIKKQYSIENSFKKMCNELLTLWKGKFTNPKWEQVTQALRDVQLNNLAEKLEKAIVVEKTVEEKGLKRGKHRC